MLVLDLESVSSIDHRDEQLISLAGGLPHIVDPLTHGLASGIISIILGLFEGIVGIQGLHQVVHLLVEHPSRLSLGL